MSHYISCFLIFRQYCNQNQNTLVLLDKDILISDSSTQKNIENVDIYDIRGDLSVLWKKEISLKIACRQPLGQEVSGVCPDSNSELSFGTGMAQDIDIMYQIPSFP